MSFVRSLSRWLCAGAALLCLLKASPADAESYTFHHEHVLGTTLELGIDADSDAAAAQAEAAALAEIERLAQVFSGYDATSEFSRWQTSDVGTTRRISPELFEVLAACDRWRTLSQEAFNPAVQELSALWQEGVKQRRLPEEDAIAASVKRIQGPHWQLDNTKRSATRLSAVPLTLNAIAKGRIVEAACQAASRTAGIHGMLVAIGGDLRVCGNTVRQIGISDPANDAVNAQPIAKVFLRNRALATSGGYRRGFQIGETWYSHIFDPRTGYPARKAASATIVADNTADADALATICCVLSTEESLALVESLPGAQCLLIGEDGRRVTSSGWSEIEQPQLFRLATAVREKRPPEVTEKTELVLAETEKNQPQGSDDNPKEAAPAELLELTVKFELHKPGGAQYRRPYVAVWLEDKDEFPVRTAVLWMQTRQPGPRWHRDLLRWYRNDGVRKLADGKELIGTVSGATRGPGEYKAIFDGKDDSGAPLKAGSYTLFIEVAREHGTYQLIRHPLKLGSDPIEETKLKGNVEIKSATVEYRARKSDSADKPARQ